MESKARKELTFIWLPTDTTHDDDDNDRERNDRRNTTIPWQSVENFKFNDFLIGSYTRKIDSVAPVNPFDEEFDMEMLMVQLLGHW